MPSPWWSSTAAAAARRPARSRATSWPRRSSSIRAGRAARAERRRPAAEPIGPEPWPIAAHRPARAVAARASSASSTGRSSPRAAWSALVGYAMLYSAAGGAHEPWAWRHGVRFGVGLGAMLVVALIDIRFWFRLAWPIYARGPARLVAVELLGIVGMGAQRWIDLGLLQLQPSELMKIGLVLALARWFHGAWLEDVARPTLPAGAGPADPACRWCWSSSSPTSAPRHAGRRRRRAAVPRRRALWMFALVLGAGAAGRCRCSGSTCTTTRAARADLPRPRERPARRRLPHHPVEDRARLGRAVGQGLPAGHPGPAQLPAGEADRLHLHHAGRGVRPGRRARAARAVRAADRLRPGRSRCAPAASSAGCWRSASRSTSSSMSSSTSPW